MEGQLNAFVEGNLGRNAEMSVTATGKQVVKSSVAINTPSGKTEWVDVNVWGQAGLDLLDRLVQGARVQISGRPQATAWNDERGELRTRLVINVNAAKYITIVERTNRGHAAPVTEPEASEIPF